MCLFKSSYLFWLLFFVISAISVGPCAPDLICLLVGIIHLVVLLWVSSPPAPLVSRTGSSTALLQLIRLPDGGIVLILF